MLTNWTIQSRYIGVIEGAEHEFDGLFRRKRALDRDELEFPIPALKPEVLAIFGIGTCDQGRTQSVKLGTRTGSGYEHFFATGTSPDSDIEHVPSTDPDIN